MDISGIWVHHRRVFESLVRGEGASGVLFFVLFCFVFFVSFSSGLISSVSGSSFLRGWFKESLGDLNPWFQDANDKPSREHLQTTKPANHQVDQ